MDGVVLLRMMCIGCLGFFPGTPGAASAQQLIRGSRKLRYMQSQPDLVSFHRRGQAKDRKVTWTREILSWRQQVGLVNRAGMARIKKA